MENFIVSARKYRPATFDTVVGQAAITGTLKNAIKSNHLAQAFLFCGPRGVGKTTCARILAKTINCFNITENIEACDECDSCKSFNSGQSLNVYELDAASNNSVEDIRSLVEQVRFAPQIGTKKVYIIDEVHMLSQGAFNAFLKTLEEPPKHAIFILATTEKHKIIPTILSRCQIFDFNRIQVEDIANHLMSIAQKENISADPDALHIIAQKADGALRDALSIFDQIVSFAGNNISYEATIENLNILDYDYYFKITDSLWEGNIPTSLLIFNEILNHGFDGHNFTAGLGEHFRNLMVCKDSSTLQLLEVGANIKDRYQEQSATCSLSFIMQGLNLINKCDIQYKQSKNQRLQVELLLLQLGSLNASPSSPDAAGETMQKKKTEHINIKAPSPKNFEGEAPSANTSTTKENTSTPTPTAPTPSGNQNPPKKAKIKTSTASINQFVGATKENTEDKESTQKEKIILELGKDDFNPEQLKAFWKNFADEAKKKGKINLFNTLSVREPELKENFLVEFALDNRAQEEEIEKEKVEFLSYLRTKLNNGAIQLSLIIIQDDTERKPYTAGDKFKRMAEKNPNINKLKQQFDLEIDL